MLCSSDTAGARGAADCVVLLRTIISYLILQADIGSVGIGDAQSR